MNNETQTSGSEAHTGDDPHAAHVLLLSAITFIVCLKDKHGEGKEGENPHGKSQVDRILGRRTTRGPTCIPSLNTALLRAIVLLGWVRQLLGWVCTLLRRVSTLLGRVGTLLGWVSLLLFIGRKFRGCLVGWGRDGVVRRGSGGGVKFGTTAETRHRSVIVHSIAAWALKNL